MLTFIFIHLFVDYLFFSEAVATESRQTLLRYRANKIADYEALHHIHLWKNEPDPQYDAYYKNFEEWYCNIKKDVWRKIHIFKKADYDNWKYDQEIGAIEENTKKDTNAYIEELLKGLSD